MTIAGNCPWCRRVVTTNDPQIHEKGRSWHQGHYILYKKTGMPPFDINGFVPRPTVRSFEAKINNPLQKVRNAGGS